MNKRKFGASPVTEAVAADLDRFAKETPAGFESLLPFLASIREERERTAPPPKLPTRQATDFPTVLLAAKALGVTYNEMMEGSYTLKGTAHNNAIRMNPLFDGAIKELHTNKYVGTRYDESLARTVLDLILVDRLQHLDDEDTYRQLRLSAEVPVSLPICDDDGKHELVKGRADWALGYGNDKTTTGSILVAIEAKPRQRAQVGLPQLLVYMAAIQEARRGYINNVVFGMVSDSREFRFAFLDSDKEFHDSRPFFWGLDKQVILSYIDAMVLDAIQSSPHTTPTKVHNKCLRKYRQYVRGRWAFGRHAEYEAEMAEAETEEDEVEAEVETKEDEVMAESGSELGDIVDVIEIDGCIRMVKSQMG
jgi:hypothetical protein